MLTADLVRARRRKGELVLVSLEGEDRQEALYLAGAYADLARESVGRPRAVLDEAMGQVEAPPPLQRVADGLRKLIEDRCDFEPTLDLPPDALRREVFRRAAERRRELGPDESFDRAAVLAEIASARGLAPDALERGLYADLRGAHVLRSFEAPSPEVLLADYEDAQAQAVLLRAVRVRAEVKCGAAWGYRQLFAKLKFLRLLHSIEPLPGGGYRVDVDGPFSLFESVTKYGLQLALALPAVQACASWSVEADVRWGKAREPLIFRLAGRGPDSKLEGDAFALPPEVEAFRTGFEALKSAWRVSPSPTILNLPGAGLCVPDLVFERPKGPKVYFEVLGYWSRDAVWRRVDLIRQGLGEPLLLAASERLRVSEDVLADDPSGALYVYKGALSPRVVLKRLEARWGGETLPLPVTPVEAPPAAKAEAPPAGKAAVRAASAGKVKQTPSSKAGALTAQASLASAEASKLAPAEALKLAPAEASTSEGASKPRKARGAAAAPASGPRKGRAKGVTSEPDAVAKASVAAVVNASVANDAAPPEQTIKNAAGPRGRARKAETTNVSTTDEVGKDTRVKAARKR